MSDGSPVSTPVLPSRALPVMSIASNTFASDVCLPDNPATERHPHPLRAHSPENILRIYLDGPANTSTTTTSADRPARPDSCVIANSTNHPQSVSSNGGDGPYEALPEPALPPPVYTASRSTATQRLSNTTLEYCDFVKKDYPIVPARPPLRPTISFGGESRTSYYSLDSFAVHGMEKRSWAIANGEITEYERAQAERLGWTFYVCFAFLGVSSFLGGFNVSALATVLPYIAQRLHITAVASFWAASGFPLAATLINPLTMRLAPVTGSKTLILLGLTFLATGSLVSGTADNAAVLIAGRVLSGCGYGAISVTSHLIVNQLAGSERSGKFQKSLSALFWLGLALGPIIGGATKQAAGWRCVFWINLPTILVAFVALAMYLRLPSTSFCWSRLRRIDYLGWVLLTCSILPILLALSWAGIEHSWTNTPTLVPLFIGIVAFALFATYSRSCIDPIIPNTIFRKASAAVSCFGTFAHAAIITALLYLMPICITAIQPSTPVLTGTVLGSWTLTLALVGAITGAIISTTGHRRIIWLGWTTTTLGIGLLLLLNNHISIGLCAGLGVVGGIGLGLLYPSLSAAVQAAATTDVEIMYAGPITDFFSLLGQSIGITVGSCIFLNRLEFDTTDFFLRANRFNSLLYMDALRWVWIALCILAAIALFLAFWFTEDYRPARRRPGTAGSLV